MSTAHAPEPEGRPAKPIKVSSAEKSMMFALAEELRGSDDNRLRRVHRRMLDHLYSGRAGGRTQRMADLSLTLVEEEMNRRGI